MVGDDHDISDVEFGIHSSSGVAHDESLYSQLVHHTLREGYFLHGVALIVVETAFHGHDISTSELAKDEFTAMSFYG